MFLNFQDCFCVCHFFTENSLITSRLELLSVEPTQTWVLGIITDSHKPVGAKTLVGVTWGVSVTSRLVIGKEQFGQKQPPEIDDNGGAAQCGRGVQLAAVDVWLPWIVSALTKTGITAPVFRLKGMCPKTVRRDVISPEWLVILMTVPTSFAEKMESSTDLDRRFWASLVSEVMPFHR